jgi:two-component system response regulator ResD
MDNSIRVLVVDDEERIRRLIRMYLEREKYIVDEASDGQIALNMALEYNYGLIILDIMLPEIDGIEVCLRIRETKSTPIIMLTAKGEETNRLIGFESGTDDYMVKPFSPRELMYRVKAVLNRSSVTAYLTKSNEDINKLQFNHIVIDEDAHRVTADGTEVILTPKEYELLKYLAESPDKVFSRESLLKDIWHYEYFGDRRTVDTHIKRLREKLNNVSHDAAQMISTIWGVGYKFEERL